MTYPDDRELQAGPVRVRRTTVRVGRVNHPLHVVLLLCTGGLSAPWYIAAVYRHRRREVETRTRTFRAWD